MDKKVHFSTSIEVHEIPQESTSTDSTSHRAADEEEESTFASTAALSILEGIDVPKKDLFFYRNGRAEDMCGIDDNRRLRILEALEAVLDEQVDQWATGIVDPERIAKLYRKYSASSQAKAIEYGLQNHLAAIMT